MIRRSNHWDYEQGLWTVPLWYTWDKEPKCQENYLLILLSRIQQRHSPVTPLSVFWQRTSTNSFTAFEYPIFASWKRWTNICNCWNWSNLTLQKDLLSYKWLRLRFTTNEIIHCEVGSGTTSEIFTIGTFRSRKELLCGHKVRPCCESASIVGMERFASSS